MPATDRQHMTFRSIAQSPDAVMIDPADLPVITDERLAIARAEADADCVEAAARHSELRQTFDALVADRARLDVDVDVARTAVSESREQQAGLELAAKDAYTGACATDSRQDELTRSLGDDLGVSTIASDLRCHLDSVIAALIGQWVSPEVIDASSSELQAIGSTASELGLHAGGALLGWALSLRGGAAELHPAGAQLYAAIESAARTWAEIGADDPRADPLVAAAHDHLDAARLALVELDSEAQAGALGDRTRRAIETAHAHRSEVEGRPKFDPQELADAVAAETTALHRVGFDSMLDFRIVMSTGGSGVLVNNQRTMATNRVTAEKAELDVAIQDWGARREQLRKRIEQLDTDARSFVGPQCAGNTVDGLRGLLALPDDVASGRAELDTFVQMAQHRIETARHEIDELNDQQLALRVARAEALTAMLGVSDTIEEFERKVEELTTQLTELDGPLEEQRHCVEEAAAELERANEDAAALRLRNYLPADVVQLREELIAVLIAHATPLQEDVEADDAADADAELPEHAEQPEQSEQRVVVVQEPLAELDDEDALEVLDELSKVEWPVTVVMVTSSPALIARCDQGSDGNDTRLRCLAPSQRVRDRLPWRRRAQSAALTDR